MVDVYRRLPIDEKSDIWALGVFLYKLCYYTTPFEDKGTLAILNATFTFPALPSYSTKIKNLIGFFRGNRNTALIVVWTLKENPKDRPNIYEVVKAVSILRGSEIPIPDVSSQLTALMIDILRTNCYAANPFDIISTSCITPYIASTLNYIPTCYNSNPPGGANETW